MNAVHAVSVHVIGKSARAPDPGNEDGVFTRGTKLRKHFFSFERGWNSRRTLGTIARLDLKQSQLVSGQVVLYS